MQLWLNNEQLAGLRKAGVAAVKQALAAGAVAMYRQMLVEKWVKEQEALVAAGVAPEPEAEAPVKKKKAKAPIPEQQE